MREFDALISGIWSQVLDLSESCRLVQVFKDRLEGIE